MPEEYIQAEEQIISLLLSDKEAAKRWTHTNIGADNFDKTHQNILSGVTYAFNNDVQLTRQTYKDFLTQYNKITKPEQLAAEIGIYNRCLMRGGKINDLPMLLEKVKAAFIRRRTATYLNDYRKDKDTLGDLGANRALIDKLAALEADSADSNVKLIELHKAKDDFLEKLYERRNNPDSRLICDIPEIDETMNVGFKIGHLTMFCAEVGSFKCVLSSELINTYDGSYLTAQELFDMANQGIRSTLLSLNEENGRIVPQQLQSVINNGIKEVFEIRTRSGFSVSVTGNHPLRHFNGWVRTVETKIGDRIAIGRIGTFGTESIPTAQALWIGCMLSDGCTRGAMQQFSNADDKIVSAFENATHILGGTIKLKTYNNCDHRGSGLKHIARHYGFDNTLAINKSIHREIYCWDRSSLIELLRAMYGCDGSFSEQIKKSKTGTKTRREVIYSTSSKQLAIGVRDLLLKFGLVGRIFTFMSGYTREDGTKHKREAYRVYLSDAKQVARFIREIGFLGEKQIRAEAALSDIDRVGKKENPNIDLIPSDVWDVVEKKFINGKTNHGCRRFLKGEGANRTNCPTICPTIWSRRTAGVSRSKLRKIAEYLDNDKELLQICDSDIYWDEVVSIESIGYHQTYDIAMPTHHNFVANNVITHNTTMMVNVALNLFKQSKQQANILYIPLEMPGDEIIQKIVARETQIPFNLIEHAENLSEEQIKMIAEEMDRWHNLSHRFCILEAAERTKVSQLRREIEKRINYFKPRMVFVDYADNLLPDNIRGRSDEQMNDTLEDLRKMGKALGFGIVSAAQLSRDALKKLKESSEKNQRITSTDIRGGQVMAANSDTVYAQWRNPAQPSEELLFTCIKARHGKNLFRNDRDKTILKVRADIGLIESPNGLGWNGSANDPILAGLNAPPPIGAADNLPIQGADEDGSPF